MSQLLAAAYPWTKALHIVSIIAWMAGLLYLPRLFVYHSQAEAGSPLSETFKVMERRLLRGIMNPAMIASYVFGLAVLFTPGIVDWQAWWIYAKLGLVVALSSGLSLGFWSFGIAQSPGFPACSRGGTAACAAHLSHGRAGADCRWASMAPPGTESHAQ